MVKHTVLISFLSVFAIGLTGILIFPYYTINPGVVIEDHTMLKNDCLSCHSLGEGVQTEKCIKCHKPTEIGLRLVNGMDRVDLNNKSNLLHQSIIDIQCFDCHTEHNGLSRENATLKFRHDILTVELQSECTICHRGQKPGDDFHKDLILNCSECHSNEAWIPPHFKHELLGERINECKNCHESKQPKDVLHKSLGNLVQCVQCHNTNAWKPSTFDHSNYFRFDNNHPSDCTNCHKLNRSFESYTCYNCHEHNPARIEKKHLKEGIRNFGDCVECHRSGDDDEIMNKKKRKLMQF
jgi:hypothetical protein